MTVAGADVGQQQPAVEEGHDVVAVGIVRQDEPGRRVLQRPCHPVLDEPRGGPLLGVDVPGARRPLEGAHRQRHHAEQDQHGLVEVWLARRPRARSRGWASAGRGAPRRDGRCSARTCGRRPRRASPCTGTSGAQLNAARPPDGLGRGRPGGAVDLEAHGGELREDREDAVDRAEVAAPDPLVAPVEQADRDRRERRAAEDGEDRLRIAVHAGHLPVDRGAGERQERPARPGDPARHRVAAAPAAGELAQRALGAEDAAPRPADQHHADQHERPPDPPEGELRGQRQVGPDMRGVVRGAAAAPARSPAPRRRRRSAIARRG